MPLNLRFPIAPLVSNSATYVNYVDGQSSSAPQMVTSSSDPQSAIELLRPFLQEVSAEEFFGIPRGGNNAGK